MSLTTLPRELRDLIYGFALLQPSRIRQRHKATCERSQRERGQPEQPPFIPKPLPSFRVVGSTQEPAGCGCAKRRLDLLLVSRQIHAEAAPVFWSKSTHTFENAEMFVEDMGRLRPEYRNLIRHICIVSMIPEPLLRHSYGDVFPIFMSRVWEHVLSCKSLRTLEAPPSFVEFHADENQRLGKELLYFETLTILTITCFIWPRAETRHQDTVYVPYPLEVPLDRIKHEEDMIELVRVGIPRHAFSINNAVHEQLLRGSRCRPPRALQLRLCDTDNEVDVTFHDGTTVRLEFLGLPNGPKTHSRNVRERIMAKHPDIFWTDIRG
ncbi:Uu.00g115900.m01.CDS01 [Anthostomella pinea]|uniref:Uu.00g115900.m01.CDS01 n=1 Tax=Anthostomella pinea TaxID=933095 RepID=A0AAI8VGM8_9PEZI|nr:Uu.00g115900.m01.CDS01 [Anthostomella pinea]